VDNPNDLEHMFDIVRVCLALGAGPTNSWSPQWRRARTSGRCTTAWAWKSASTTSCGSTSRGSASMRRTYRGPRRARPVQRASSATTTSSLRSRPRGPYMASASTTSTGTTPTTGWRTSVSCVRTATPKPIRGAGV